MYFIRHGDHSCFTNTCPKTHDHGVWLLYRKSALLAKRSPGAGALRAMDLTPKLFCDTVDAMSVSDLNASLIRNALTTQHLGHPVLFCSVVDSTMDEARRLIARNSPAGLPDGTLLVADEQTGGRGRLQRSWWAPPASSLLLSLVFRPPLAPHQAQRITMICSLAVCDAIFERSGLSPQVKWPNDVLIDGRKVCGILTELDLVGSHLDYVIVGIGINVNVDLAAAPPLMSPATSLLAETGHTTSRLELLIALLANLERRYAALQDGHSFHQEWASRMATLGEQVEVAGGSERWTGVAVGVDSDGALLVRTDDGDTQRILAADVTLRSPESACHMPTGRDS
jgi:BirA family biotin operon repressor/biotin-[acetyl-CoA-carboxylase] ligase